MKKGPVFQGFFVSLLITYISIAMSVLPSFKIHADLDGFLDDPVHGPLNEMIYQTILELSEPNTASNRHYPLRHPALVIFKESYSLMNDFANSNHPEDGFVQNHFSFLRDRLLDTYAAEAVLSVGFVLLSHHQSKKSLRLIAAIKRTINPDSACFKAFEPLASVADYPELPADDWHSKYLDLQERYFALSALYQSSIPNPPASGKDRQLSLSLDIPYSPVHCARLGVVQVKDLLNTAVEANSSDIFQVLRFYLAKSNDNLLELVKVNQETFLKRSALMMSSNLALSKTFSKIDCIRVFRALYEAGKITSRDGSKLSLKAYFKTVGDFLGIDLSDASTIFSASLADSYSGDKHTAIFNQLAQSIITLFNSK